ncbi:hypothetical protein KUTeg_020431 [Tegillarca granosa]|uniref:D-isomer specific 2-hydroxyacid dehydrogenase NAD-binding domain-containing protein n=1 Tax=Tegillarca granosa TaxID=220873 RepID=A0ABQ9E7V2_TEGGR|nr:hypothetical protein KUTeg_020431 [Tegillarca granosa]
MRRTNMTNKPTVYVIQSFSFQPHCMANYVKELLPGVEVIELLAIPDKEFGHLSEETKKVVRENAEVLFCSLRYIRDVIYSSKRLKWAQSISRGIDMVFTGRDKTKPFPDVLLTKTGRPGTAMGEYVIGQIIAWERSFYKAYENKRQKVWYRAVEQLPDLLENCDFICGALPSTPETRGLLSGDVLKHCQSKKSVLINVGRGDLIDESSILLAIKNGWINGAILDVFEKEPLSKDSELWDLPNVIITPHVALSDTHKSYVEHFVDNYKRYIKGQPLEDRIDWEKGY